MNTLSKAITAHFFASSDQYNALRAHWSTLMNSQRREELSAAHHLLYLALLGKDWRKSFAPITNQRKLQNGAFIGWEMFQAIHRLHSHRCEAWLLAPFEGIVTVLMLQLVRRLVTQQNPYAAKPEAFSNGSFPIEAYQQEAALALAQQEPAHV